MNLTINDSCSIITANTPTSNQLEEWYNGNLSDVQVTISYNCQQVNEFNLPNIPILGLITTCNVENSRAAYTAIFSGLSDIVSSTLVSSSATVDSVTKVSETEYFVIADTSGNTHQLVFDVVNSLGDTFRLTADASAASNISGEECLFSMSYTTELLSLRCGLEFDETTFSLNIYNEYLRADCNTPCTDCRKYCDGIYTIQIGSELSCIFVNCSTDCESIEYFSRNEGDILQLLEATKIGSSLTSIGQTDCITCTELCMIYDKIARLLDRVTTTRLEDCGCNNN